MSHFKMPVENPKLTSAYSKARKHPKLPGVIRMHAGVDLINTKMAKAPILASAAGKVRLVKTTKDGYGKHLIITHNLNGVKYETLYAHLDSISVKNGQTVKQGQKIGIMGNTGIGTGIHLHFEIHKGTYSYANGTYPNSIDPWPLLNEKVVKTMQLSTSGLSFIKKHEGLKLYWYELADGGLTCGYGHYVPMATAKKLGIKKGTSITQKQADDYLKEDLKKFAKGTNEQLQQFGFTVNQNQFDVLVSYSFNRGLGNTAGTNGLRQLLKNSKTVADISKNLVIYWGTNQTYKNGLIKRRKAEQVLFNTPVKTNDNRKEDEKVYSSKSLKDEHEITRGSAARHKIIVEAAIDAGYNESWREKLEQGTVTADDIDALAAGTLVRLHKK